MTDTATEHITPGTEQVRTGEGRPTTVGLLTSVFREVTENPPPLVQFRASELLELSNTLELINSAEAHNRAHTPEIANQRASATELVRRSIARAEGKQLPPITSKRLTDELNDRGVYKKTHKISHYAPITSRMAHLLDREYRARGIPPGKMDNQRLTFTPDELRTTLNLLVGNTLADRTAVPPETPPGDAPHLNEIRFIQRGIQRTNNEPLSEIEGPLGLQFKNEPTTTANARGQLEGAVEPSPNPGLDEKAETGPHVVEGDPVETIIPAPEHPENAVEWVHRLQELRDVCMHQTTEAQEKTIIALTNALYANVDGLNTQLRQLPEADRMLLYGELTALYRSFFAVTAPDAPIALYPDGIDHAAAVAPYTLVINMTDTPAVLRRMGIDPTPTNIARQEAYVQNVNGPLENRRHLRNSRDAGLHLSQVVASAVYPKEAVLPQETIENTDTGNDDTPETTKPRAEKRRKMLSEKEKQRETDAIFTEAADVLLFQGDTNGYMGMVMAKHADVHSEAGRMWRRHMLEYIKTYNVDVPRKPYVRDYLQQTQQRITDQILPAGNPPGELAAYLQKRFKLTLSSDELTGFTRGDSPSIIVLLDTRLRPHMDALWFSLMGPQNMEKFFTTNALLVNAGPHRSEDWAPWSKRRVRLNRLKDHQRESYIHDFKNIRDGQLFAGSSFLTLLAREQLPAVTVTATSGEATGAPPPAAEPPPGERPKPETAEKTTGNETRERSERRRWLTNFSREALTIGDARLHFATRIALEADTTSELGRQFQREVLAMVKQYDLGRVTDTVLRTRLQKMQHSIPDTVVAVNPQAPRITDEIRNRRSQLSESRLRKVDERTGDYFMTITDEAYNDLQVPLGRVWAAVMPKDLSQEKFFAANRMAGPDIYAREQNGKRINWVALEKTLQKAYRRAIRDTTFNTTPLGQTAFTETLLSVYAFESREPVAATDMAHPVPVDNTPVTIAEPVDTDEPGVPNATDTTLAATESAVTDEQPETLASSQRIPEQTELTTPAEQQAERLRILARVARVALDAGDARLFYAVRLASRANIKHPQGLQFQREILAMLPDYTVDHISNEQQRRLLQEVLASVPPELAQLENRPTTGELLQGTGIPADDRIRRIATRTGDYKNVVSVQVNRGILGAVIPQRWRDIMGTNNRDAFFTAENLGTGLPDEAVAQITRLNKQFLETIPSDYPIGSDRYRAAFAEVLAMLLIHDADKKAEAKKRIAA